MSVTHINARKPAKPPAKTESQKSKDYRERKKQRLEALAAQVAAFEASPKSTSVALRDCEVLDPSRPVPPPVAPRGATWRHWFCAIMQPNVIASFLLAVVFGSVGFYQSGAYGWAFGLTTGSGATFAVPQIAAEVVALFGLALMSSLWRRRRYALATGAIPIYCGALTIVVFSAVGFTTTNIDDSLAGREQARDLRTAIIVDIGRKRDELGKVPAHKNVSPASVDASKAELALKCPPDVNSFKCRTQLVPAHKALQADADLTAQAKTLESDIAKLEGDLRTTKAIKSADPTVEGLRRLTLDHISSEFVINYRMAWPAAATFLGAFFLACAKALVEASLAAAVKGADP